MSDVTEEEGRECAPDAIDFNTEHISLLFIFTFSGGPTFLTFSVPLLFLAAKSVIFHSSPQAFTQKDFFIFLFQCHNVTYVFVSSVTGRRTKLSGLLDRYVLPVSSRCNGTDTCPPPPPSFPFTSIFSALLLFPVPRSRTRSSLAFIHPMPFNSPPPPNLVFF